MTGTYFSTYMFFIEHPYKIAIVGILLIERNPVSCLKNSFKKWF